MKKYIGVFPYLYLEETKNVGTILLIPILVGERNTVRSAEDENHIQNLIKLFRDGRGYPLVAATYFMVDISEQDSIESILNNIHLYESLFKNILSYGSQLLTSIFFSLVSIKSS